jgi:uncharacterized protein YdaL
MRHQSSTNQKTCNRRKAQKKKLLKEYKDKLEEAINNIDPQTCEGQSKLNIDIISANSSTTTSTTTSPTSCHDFESIESPFPEVERQSYYSYFRNLFRFKSNV